MKEEIPLLLKNKYRLDRKIARGGMSDIFLCTNIELGNLWIAKRIDRIYDGLLYEEEILKKLNHISLPKIIDICRDDTGIYIIESYIEGSSLQNKISSLGRLNLYKAIDYALKLCEVLIYLHNMKPVGIIHRDIKPSNIIVTEYDQLVLIDFGISSEQGAIGRSIKSGTSAYAAPEQFAETDHENATVDVYSLGIVLHQMITGSLPGREALPKLNSQNALEKAFLEICQRCSCFNPKDRYQKVEEIKKDLIILRNKYILIKENGKIKRKIAIILIGLFSILNYICLYLSFVLF